MGDVHHARHTQQRTVCINHWGRIKGSVSCMFKQVQHDHDAQLFGELLEHLCGRSRDGLSKSEPIPFEAMLREEGLECHFGKGDDVRTLGCGPAHILQSGLPIGNGIRGRNLLDECNTWHQQPSIRRKTRVTKIHSPGGIAAKSR